ncbi:MAG: hypothetical protein ACSLFN_12410 [Candidatus Limnocylindrales bacterium]
MIQRSLIRLAAITSIAAALIDIVADAVRGWPSGGFHLLYGAIAIVFIAVGWLIAERRPGNAVGALLVTFGGAFAWYLPADSYLDLWGDHPAAVFGALFISALDAPMFILLALILIHFPDGRLPSARWQPTRSLAAVGVALTIVGHALDARPMPLFPEYSSPFGIAGFPGHELVYAAYVVMLVVLVLGAWSLLTRWRRGDPLTRVQIKWVAAAALVMLVAEIFNVATFDPRNLNAVTTVVSSITIALIPIAIGIAVLRYRLYAIDRIVSRTIAYGIVSAVLGAVFAVCILALQGLLAPFTDEQTIAVAASTLAVFALFQPLRRRVQGIVDRRFDRARYDADHIVATFAARLRGDIDLSAVNAEIVGSADAAVRPSVASIWVRDAHLRKELR